MFNHSSNYKHGWISSGTPWKSLQWQFQAIFQKWQRWINFSHAWHSHGVSAKLAKNISFCNQYFKNIISLKKIILSSAFLIFLKIIMKCKCKHSWPGGVMHVQTIWKQKYWWNKTFDGTILIYGSRKKKTNFLRHPVVIVMVVA